MNPQRTKQAKAKRLERQLGARMTDDPDGVMAVLQTARRLLSDGGELFKDGWEEQRPRKKPTVYSFMGALRRAVDLAHPKDRSRALWAAQHALQGAVEKDPTKDNGIAHVDKPVITRWESHPKTTLNDALRVYDAAIKSQGTVNLAQKKMNDD